MIGQTISHYKILNKLGEGGMGIVYKAQDTKLNRTVGLKFLPDRVQKDTDAKARFLQEAQAAAGLNHPNICTIHGVEEVDGSLFMVMEYIEGGTLREKLPFAKSEDAIAIAGQIGEALQEAHSKGIVHRDVKADNVMLTSKGQAKVMDFGLAKLKGALKLTRTSSTVGTLGYMAPEQIQGGEVDHRSDIFSFGVLLFEILTGRLPFRGEHEAAMVYSIVNEEPQDISPLLPELSPIIVNLIQRCLEKDPSERYQHFDDIVADLKRAQKKTSRVMKSSQLLQSVQAVTSVSMSVDPPAQSSPTPRTVLNSMKWLIAGLTLVVVFFLLYTTLFRTDDRSGGTSIAAQFEQFTIFSGVESTPSFSPDGNFVAYARLTGNRWSIYLQRVGGGNSIELTKDLSDVRSPAFSPDGQRIAFCSISGVGGIFVMGATGESVRRVSDIGFDPSWSPDGREIVVATELTANPNGRNTVSKLIAIDVSSGDRRTVYEGDGVQPNWSPHGDRIAFWGLPTGTGRRDIFTIASNGGDPVAVTTDAFVDWNPVWSPNGEYLYFCSDRGGSQNLWRVAVDEKTGKALGEPTPITAPSPFVGNISISRDGARIAYASYLLQGNLSRHAFDPVKESFVGSPSPVTQGSRVIGFFSVSPDGKRIAYNTSGSQEDIFVINSDGTGERQLTDDPHKDRAPEFSPDQERIIFYSNRSGRYDAWILNLDGSGLDQTTKTTGAPLLRPRWFPDGKRISVQIRQVGYTVDLTKSLDERIPEQLPLMDQKGTLFSLGGPVSPDGKWIGGSRMLADSSLPPGLFTYSVEERSYHAMTDSGFSFRWYPDSRRFFYRLDPHLYLMDRITKRSHQVSGMIPMDEVGEWSFSPDGRYLYFVKFNVEGDLWIATLK